MIISIFVAFICTVLFYKKTLPEISKNQKWILIAFRTLFIYALLLLLFNPILYFKSSFTERPVFLMLSDKSNSMNQIIEGKTKAEHLSRFERVFRDVATSNNYSVMQIDLFKNNPRQSVLLDEIKDVLQSGVEIKGIALASDGWFQDDQSIFREIIDIPIYTFNPEFVEINAEMNITSIHYNKNVNINELQLIRINFKTNNFDGNVQAVLKHEDKVIQSKDVHITRDMDNLNTAGTIGMIDFEFSFAETGLKVFEIDIFSTENNEIGDKGFAAVQVLDDKAKILILSDSFSWDVRVFNRYLNFGERFDVELAYVHKQEFRQHGDPININWHDYSGFIIFNHGNFSMKENDALIVKNMILNGTGLIFVGNLNDVFEDILPTRASNIRVTSEGQVHLHPIALSYQIFRDIESHWSGFPPVQYHYLTAKEHSIVLAEVHDLQRIPVLFLGNYGTGNIFHFAFNGLWRWQLNSDPEIFDRFISGVGQWIFGKSKDNFHAFTDKNIYYSGERITVKLAAFDERLSPLRNVNARIEVFDLQAIDQRANQHESEKIVFSDFLVRTDDLYTINLPDLKSGTYSYTIIDDVNQRETSSEFEVLDLDIQDQSKGFNHRLLSALSQASVGINMTDDDLNRLSLERAESTKHHKYTEIPLYKNVFFIALFLLTFCTELYLRKKWGLL